MGVEGDAVDDGDEGVWRLAQDAVVAKLPVGVDDLVSFATR